MEKLENYIENIEQLGADARFENDNKNYDVLKIKLESIIWWAKKSLKTLEKEGE